MQINPTKAFIIKCQLELIEELQAKANNYDSLVEEIKEIKAQSEKENKPYEEYNKESRMYWINEGKKSVCQELLDTEQ